MNGSTLITELKSISDFLVSLEKTFFPCLENGDRHKIISLLVYGAALSHIESEDKSNAAANEAFKQILCDSIHYSNKEAEETLTNISLALKNNVEPVSEIVAQGKELLADYNELAEEFKSCILDRILYSHQLLITSM